MENNSQAQSKEAVLSRIRAAKPLFSSFGELSGNAASLDSPERNSTETIGRFIKELNLLGVECYEAADSNLLIDRLRSIIQNKVILSWDSDQLPYDLGEVYNGENVIFENGTINEQAKAEIGITGCEAAIAETGSIVLIPGPGKPQTASLLPFFHVAIAKRSSLFFTMGEWLDSMCKDVVSAPYINIITGPSRTADIELTLTLGVHGPGKMIVLLGP